MKRNSLFTKIAALMLCVMMVIGCLPMSAFADWEGEILVEPTYKDLTIGDNELKVYTGMAETIYSWTADAEGTLSITMPNYIGWSYELKIGETVVAESSTADAEVIANPSIDVEAGNVVTLSVETNGQTVPVTTNIVATFELAKGIESNPYFINIPDGGDYTIKADATAWFNTSLGIMAQTWSGTMTVVAAVPFSVAINGEEIEAADNGEEGEWKQYTATVNVSANMMYGGPSFQIINEGAKDTFYVSFAEAAGSYDNPDWNLNVGTADAPGANVCNGNGYFYAYMAEEAGTFYIEMKDSNWNDYQLMLPYLSVQNDTRWAIDETPVTTDSIEMPMGAYLLVCITGSNAEFDAWFVPAAVEPEPTDPEETDPPVETVPVVTNDQTGKSYSTVAEALSEAVSGQTVTMIASSVEGGLIVPAGVTLHLKSFSLTADYIVGLSGSYVRAGTMSGKLIVPKDSVSLTSVARDGSNAAWNVIPIWIDETASLAGHYEFGQIQLSVNNSDDLNKTDADNGTATLDFFTYYNSGTKPFIKDSGASDHDFEVTVMVSYIEDGIQIHKQYVYLDSMVMNAADNYNLFCTLIDCLSFENLEFTICINSGTGVVVQSKTYTY